MNKVILVGYLAADPESRTTQSGIAQCTLRLAVQRRFANQQGERESDFFNVVCWRQTAEFCTRYLSKGRKIAVAGSLQNRSYEAKDGSKRYVTEVIAESVEFCDRRDDRPGATASQPVAPPVARPAPNHQTSMAEMGFSEVEDDDLPF